MPIVIPPFVQYQQPIVPLRGLWNTKPKEGEFFANIEIVWGETTTGRALQILMSANSPVAFSQIVALYVDNRKCGYDVDFVFPDSNFTLTVPAYQQGLYPVFTNALMFYIVGAEGINEGNDTVVQVCNSLPPPVTFAPTSMQSTDAVSDVSLAANGTTAVVPAGINGTLQGFTVTVNAGSTGTATLQLVDGTGKVLLARAIDMAQGDSQVITVTGISVRFANGLNFIVSNAAFTAAAADASVFYTTP